MIPDDMQEIYEEQQLHLPHVSITKITVLGMETHERLKHKQKYQLLETVTKKTKHWH